MPSETSPTPPEQEFYAAGFAQFEKGETLAAIESFKRALIHNMDYIDAHFMLGVCYAHECALEQAIDHYQIASLAMPGNTECWHNLAKARAQAGRYREALSAIRQARKHAENPHAPDLIKTLGHCIAPMDDFDVNPAFIEEVTRCFHTPEVESRKLVPIAQKLFLHQAVVKKLLEHHSPVGFRDFDALLTDTSLNWPVLGHPLFIRLMSDHVVWLDEIEKILSGLRAHLLAKAQNGPLDKEKLWPGALAFICALAQQCFFGEYVYDISKQEQEHLEALKSRAGQTFEPYDIALLACYKPLYETPFAQDLLGNDALLEHESLRPVMRMQIVEPAEEKSLLGSLQRFTAIEDEVSLKVKEQYEAYPYPRWVSSAVEESCSLRHLLHFQFPHLDEKALPDENFTPDVLFAGCGTGRQSVEWSLLLPNSKGTAIDITAASLAYAQRKTREMGVDNIEYGLADILKLKEIDRQFDVIHSAGVLHHMADPMKGWQTLTDILKPGGFMMIALYSEIGRRHIQAAREYIAQQNIPPTPEGMRALRQHIRKLPATHPMKYIMDHQDFYSLSECRDLLFHVQEYCFAAPELKKCIDTLGLEFLGFQKPMLPGVIESYQAQFPDDPYGLDLDNWHTYELQHPMTFKGMYQFWLRKPE